MSDKYNLSGLTGLFREAVDRKETTISFEIKNGKGRFVFLMFFDQSDEKTKDFIYIYMRNTNKLIELKLYGNHYGGQFDLWLPNYVKQCIIDELQINNPRTNNDFSFNAFFRDINSSIPQSLPLSEKAKSFKKNWNSVKGKLPKSIVDDYKKTIFVGIKKLPDGHRPQEKTLRKLYLIGEDSDKVASLINLLKNNNQTTIWTDDETKRDKARKYTDLIN